MTSVAEPTTGGEVAATVGPGRRSRRRLVALVAGTTAGGVVVAGVSSGVLVGAPALVLLVLGLVLVPSARSLSERLAVNGAVLLGATPLLWWSVWPLAVSHGAVVLGLLTSGLTAWIVSATGSGRRSGSLLPEVGAVDTLPLATGLATTAALGRWVFAGRGEAALAQLVSGFDASSHVGIFVMMRSSGTTVSGVPLPEGAWAFGDYPAGYHAVAVTLADLVHGRPGDAAEQMQAWNVSMVLVAALCTTVLVGSLLSVATLRRRVGPAAIGAALLFGAFVLGPGAVALADGFAPFWYAEALLGAGLLIAVTAPRPLPLGRIAAVGAVVVGVAQAWAPLDLLLLPALVAALTPWSTVARRGARWWWGAAALAALTLLGTVPVALSLMSTVPVGTLVEATGGYSPPAPLPLLGVVVATVLVLRRASRPAVGTSVHSIAGPTQGAPEPWPPRFRTMLWTPLVGAVISILLLATQVHEQGRPDYYFYKFLTGVELACLPLLALGTACLLARRPARGGLTAACAAVAVVLAAVLGALLQPLDDSGFRALRSNQRSGTADVGSGVDPDLVARTILRAVDASSPRADREVLVSFRPAALREAALTQRWFLALTQAYTSEAGTVSLDLASGSTSDRAVLESVTTVLTAHPDVVVLVARDRVEQVRASLGSEALRARVRAF